MAPIAEVRPFTSMPVHVNWQAEKQTSHKSLDWVHQFLKWHKCHDQIRWGQSFQWSARVPQLPQALLPTCTFWRPGNVLWHALSVLAQWEGIQQRLVWVEDRKSFISSRWPKLSLRLPRPFVCIHHCLGTTSHQIQCSLWIASTLNFGDWILSPHTEFGAL